MEAPEKIYLDKKVTIKRSDSSIIGAVWYDKRIHNDDVEYIRADLTELTAGDIMDISNIAEDLESKSYSMTQEEYCEEVARRFNKQRR